VQRECGSTAVAGVARKWPLQVISPSDHVARLQVLLRVMAAAVLAIDQFRTDPAVSILVRPQIGQARRLLDGVSKVFVGNSSTNPCWGRGFLCYSPALRGFASFGESGPGDH